MAIRPAPVPQAAWPDARHTIGTRRLRRLGLMSAIACGTAVAVVLLLPAPTFRARAIVAVSDPMSPLAAVLPRVAADAVVSERVLCHAAESLNGTTASAENPDLFERVAVTFGLGEAKSQTARWMSALLGQTSARAGEALGTLEVVVASPDAEAAARAATAVAVALVAEQDDEIAQTRHTRDAEAQTRIERLKAEAGAARSRLMALGGAQADPTEQRAAAAAQVATAQARADAIRSIMASGAPPLSDRRDLPSGIETLQASYLDLKRQLTKAQETLGDRHTTIISLKAEVAHAAANLSAEWRRLLHLAETDLTAKRQHDSSLRQADTPADGRRREAFETARRSVQVADENLARAQAAQEAAFFDEQAYRLVAAAPIPTVTSGWPLLVRLVLGGVAGLGMAFVVGLLFDKCWRGARPVAVDRTLAVEEDKLVMLGDRDRSWTNEAPASRIVREPTISRPRPRRAAIDLSSAMSDLVPHLTSIEPAFGDIPTIMIASNEGTADTTSVAVALGSTLADLDYRVLLVGTSETQTTLVESADIEADPILIDFFGTLRVAFSAEESGHCLYVAPSLPDGPRIASNLARASGVPIIEEAADEFDIMIVDGGRAAESADAGWSADAFVRVGRLSSRRHDDLFTAAFGIPASALIGTIAGEAFVLRESAPLSRPVDSYRREMPSARWPSPPTAVSATIPRRKVMNR